MMVLLMLTAHNAEFKGPWIPGCDNSQHKTFVTTPNMNSEKTTFLRKRDRLKRTWMELVKMNLKKCNYLKIPG